MKYDKKFQDALMELANSLAKVYELYFDEEHGDNFNEEILVGKLSKCWGMSIDEMSWSIREVADGMDIKAD